MIVKVGKAGERGAFASVLRYVTERSEDADLAVLLDTNLVGTAREELALQLRQVADQAPRCQTPVLHVIVRLAPGEARGAAAWREMLDDWRRGVGLDGAPYVAIGHGYGHVHLVVSRVGFDGRVWNPHQSHRLSRDVADRIERSHGLVRAKDHPRPRTLSVTRAEYERAQRHAAPPARVDVATRVMEAIRAGDGTQDSFTRECTRRQIAVRLNQSPTTGRIHGASFEDQAASPRERTVYKGSELGLAWRVLGPAIAHREPPRERAARDRAPANGRERVRERGMEAYGR